MQPWLHPRAAYIHVPFCAHHCGYCDFAVVAGRDEAAPSYVEALIKEIETLGKAHPVETIFIGGGTPTYLPATELEKLLAAVREWLPLTETANRVAEWSIESTPDSLDEERVRILADASVSRVSIGVQSFNSKMLQALDRRHREEEIMPAIERVRKHIPCVSLDLIFGVPGQTLDDWRADLAQAVTIGTDHISCYGLTFEKGTPLWRDRRDGRIDPVEEEIEREMFLFTHDELPKRGYEHYEISNYARPGRRSRHNEVYWANHAYLGFGLGAARYVGGRRELNTRSLNDYINRMMTGRTPTIQSELLDDLDRARETITTQLRRRDGIARSQFAEQTGKSLDELAGNAIIRFVDCGLLRDDGENVSLTREGLCVADAILTELWAENLPARTQIPQFAQRIPIQ